jgi:hypothetical protein
MFAWLISWLTKQPPVKSSNTLPSDTHLIAFGSAQDLDRLYRLMVNTEDKDLGKVIGKAILLYEKCVRETGLGAKLVLRYPDGQDTELIL